MTDSTEFERRLGGVGAAALVTGTVIGTGIFLVPGTIARETGSIGGALAVWIIGGLLSLAGALSYAELGAAFPEAGGEYAFLRRAYGPLWGFLYGWQQTVIGKTGSIASYATGFALFLAFFFAPVREDWLRLSEGFALTGAQLIGIGAILFLTTLNYFGIAVGGAVQSFLTFLKIAAILGLAGLALVSGKGDWSHFATVSSGTLAFAGLGPAMAAVLWAYDGWSNLTMVGAEVRDPERTIPKVLILGLAGVMAVYLAVNLACFYILPFTQVQASAQVAQSMATVAFGEIGAVALTIAALISSFAGLNGAILTGARVSYAMARDGLFIRALNRLEPRHRSPARALWLQGFIAVALVAGLGHDDQGYERLFNYTIFGTWLFYGAASAAVIVLRFRAADVRRPFRTPGYPWTPLIFVLIAAAFCLDMVFERPVETGLGLALLALGFPVYFYYRRHSAASAA